MWRATLKGILAQKLRLVMTGLAITIGVAFVAGTFIFSDTMNKAFDNLFTGIYANTDVVVEGSGAISEDERPPFSESIVDQVRAVPGVREAIGGVWGSAQLIKADGTALSTGGGPAQGISWDGDSPMNSMTIDEGQAPTGPDDVVLDRGTAERGGFAVGQRISIVLPTGVGEYRVSGIAVLGDGSDSLAGATTAFFTLAEAQRVLEREGLVDSIAVAAEGGISQQELRDRVAAALPDDLEVSTAEDKAAAQSQSIKDQLSFLTIFLLVFGFIAVFVAAFIIFNTFNITVAQRARQMALMRAIGASGGQVTRMVVIEAVVVGVLASLIGLGVGFLVALGVNSLFGLFGASLPTTTYQLAPRTIIVALAVGVLVTVVGALMPALRAARLEPVAALRDEVVLATGSRRRRLILGGIVLLIGVAIAVVGFNTEGVQEGLTLLGIGALAVFIGVAMLAPLIAARLSWVLGWPLVRIGGVPGRLGRGNAMRNPQRTAQTATALTIGLALVAFVSVFASSLTASIGQEIDRQLKSDIVVYDETSFMGFPSTAADNVRRQPLVEVVAPVRVGSARIGDRTTQIAGFDTAQGERVFDPEFVEGSWASIASGTIAVQADEASSNNIALGDTLSVTYPRGRAQARVSAIYDSVNVGGYLIPIEDFNANFVDRRDLLLFISGGDGADPVALQDQVDEALAEYPTLTVRNQQEYKEYIEQQVGQILGLVYALLALAIIIAVFGIVNTLALSVFERTREIGLLRAVGLSARQARRMVRYEAVIVALLGGVLGVLMGILFAVTIVASIDELPVLAIPWVNLAIFLVLAALAGVLAAVWPARRAARLDVLKAITHE